MRVRAKVSSLRFKVEKVCKMFISCKISICYILIEQ